MNSFKNYYYEKLFEEFLKALAESGMAISKEVNEPFFAALEESLYKALDVTFVDLEEKTKKPE